ncbi:MAG TPA: rhamnulokinase family protein [Planctomycetota bacterium]|nr:rhamnulokinase family protein [Planctomycetota bacterium]
MSAERKYLALDLGAESGRGMLGRFDGKKLIIEEVHRFPNVPVKVLDHIHWDVLAIFANLKQATANAVAKAGGIDSLAVDTWGVDYALLARDGSLLGNPYHYRDSRTDGIMEKVFSVVPRREIFQHTGIQFIQLNTLFQLYALVLAKSPLLDAADRLLMMPDLLNYLFTGRIVDEYTDGTTSQLMDPRDGRWVKPLFDKLGIPFRIVPDVIMPGERIANLRADIASETGAGPVPVVAVGSHDTASAVAAVPAKGSSGWCYISCGTWSLMGIEAPKPIINDKTLDYNFTNEGGVGGTIRFLKNIMGLWLVQESKREWAREGEDLGYTEITEMAANAKPMQCFVDCNSSVFLAPGGMPGRIVEFCRKTGQAAPQSKGEIVRCALESLALTYRRALAVLEDVSGGRIDVIHVVGGGTQNRLLCQLAADACNRTVIAGPVEATAIGNALMQAVALGDLKSTADLREVVRNSFSPERYEPRNTAGWDEAYVKYEKICG